MSRARRRALASCLLLALSGCTLGPNFQRPTTPELPDWRHGAGDKAVSQSTNPDPRWWDAFKDPVLTELIETAIENNLDLQQAVLRVVESRQQIVTARAAGLPTLNGTASYTRQQLGAKGILESKGIYDQLNDLADRDQQLDQTSPGLSERVNRGVKKSLDKATRPTGLYQYGLSASWELDLFGRVRRSVEQATAQEEAQEESANDSLTSLESEVAQAYIQLRGAQALTTSQEENIKVAQRALELTQRSQRQGLSSDLDVEQARTQLLDYQSQLPGYEKQRDQAIDRLNLLIGAIPGTLDARLQKVASLPKLPRVVGVGVPSTIARRRPDIRQAEAQLHAATANIGVAVAEFYPDISLTGNFGIRATEADYLTKWASHFYSFGPSISLPIFRGGQLTANLRLARAQAAAAALSYRGTVLNALSEVEDGLVAYRTDRAQRDRLAQVVRSAGDALYLANNRYTHGLEDFLQVLDAQRTLVSAKQQLVQADITLANDIVSLYRALGGGWETPGAASRAPKVPGVPPPVPGALDSLAAGMR